MPKPKQWPPRPHAHKASRQDRVKIDGRHVYLGPTGSEAAKQKYDEVIAEAEKRRDRERPPVQPDGVAATGLTVAEVIERYDRHAEVYYARGGAPTKQLRRVRRALGFVLESHRALPAARFGPLALDEVRQRMVSLGWRRNTANAHADCVVRCWAWAASRELVPASCWQALLSLGRLRKGRTAAPESDPVGPPDPAAVEAVLARLPRVVADMARVQRLTGMRGGEVCSMRVSDIDRTGEVWLYRPAEHKTAHLGRGRLVPIGPAAQAVLAVYLAVRGPDDHVFSPQATDAARRAKLAHGKRTQSARKAHGNPCAFRAPGERYTTNSYGLAIRRACAAAGVARWTSHQLRHEKATELRRLFGLDVARAVLGHSDAGTTLIYAERDLAAAAEAARKAG